jgi:hypothetical protein
VAQSPAPTAPPAPPAPAPRTPPPVPGSTWWWPPDHVVRPPKPAPPRPPVSCWEEPRRPAPWAAVLAVNWSGLQVVVEGPQALVAWRQLLARLPATTTSTWQEPLLVHEKPGARRRWVFAPCPCGGGAVGLAEWRAEERWALLVSCPACASTFGAATAPAAAPA